MKRLFIVLIKYIPIIQMVGMLFNNIKQQLIQAKQPAQQNINNAVNIWDSINNEIASMTNDQDEDSGSTKTWNYFKTAN